MIFLIAVIKMMSIILGIFIVLCNSQCNETIQTIDTFKLCQIFKNTNVESIHSNWVLSAIDYCALNANDGSLKIECDNSNGRLGTIVTLELTDNEDPKHSGELQTQYEWPSFLKNIKIQEHLFTYSFNGLNFSNILQTHLETLWFERSSNGQNAGIITGIIKYKYTNIC